MFGPNEFLYIINNGAVAYDGIVNTIRPQPGQTVVISTAAGATGLLACHLALKAKAKVIGLTSRKKI